MRCAWRLRRTASATSSAVHFGTVPSTSPVNGAYDVATSPVGPTTVTRRASRCRLSGDATGGRLSAPPVGTAARVGGDPGDDVVDDVTLPPRAQWSTMTSTRWNSFRSE